MTPHLLLYATFDSATASIGVIDVQLEHAHRRHQQGPVPMRVQITEEHPDVISVEALRHTPRLTHQPAQPYPNAVSEQDRRSSPATTAIRWPMIT
ncbi:MAG: hypothetical protein ABIR68_04250 [Ilumatobacteraceae bacterium]